MDETPWSPRSAAHSGVRSLHNRRAPRRVQFASVPLWRALRSPIMNIAPPPACELRREVRPADGRWNNVQQPESFVIQEDSSPTARAIPEW